ncbi:uncharacterized protein DFL_008922 [Arthrobotrys flagrans]|uniref:Uncharacterized protein n=1 Tax=Arthrobotrys flagrans TaxID=97331 RepID=A0A436ZQ84_ARTFL|nr:hypothetical protein DFL_008922 [Arthrobotrys flagrans]
MQPNNYYCNVHQDVDADDDILLLDAPIAPQTESTPTPINNIIISPLPYTPPLSQISLFDHYINTFKTPPLSPSPSKQPPTSPVKSLPPSPIKRLASSPPICSDVFNSIGPKRPRLDLLSSDRTIDPRFFDMDEYLLFGSDSDLMNLDFDTNTREYRKLILRSFPPRSRGILEHDLEYIISEEEQQLLRVLELSKMYPLRNLVLTEADKEKAMEMAVAYNESLAHANLPETVKEELRRNSTPKFELQMSWDKIMTHLESVQLERHAKFEWTELGLPHSELIKARGSKSMPNMKIVASVKTKIAGADLKRQEEAIEEKSPQKLLQLTDQKESTLSEAKKSRLWNFTTRSSPPDPAEAEKLAKEQKGKAQIKRMLEARSAYKITPRVPTPPNPREKNADNKSQANDESILSYAHLERYDKEFKTDTENSFTKEKEIRENIRRVHEESNKETFLKRQNDIWHAIPPPTQTKPNSWEKYPGDQHQYYTFSLQELCDAAPEQRIRFLEHNECVEASGLRKGDFDYEHDDPFGKDTYLDDNPLILPGGDLGENL